MQDEVSLVLTKNEALVLFEFLSRYSESDRLDIVDQAEQRVLWNLTGYLEKILAEPFLSEWSDILEKSQGMLRDEVV